MNSATNQTDDAVALDYAAPFAVVAELAIEPGPASFEFVWPDQSQDDAVANDYADPFRRLCRNAQPTYEELFVLPAIPWVEPVFFLPAAPVAAPARVVKTAPKPRARRRDFAFVR